MKKKKKKGKKKDQAMRMGLNGDLPARSFSLLGDGIEPGPVSSLVPSPLCAIACSETEMQGSNLGLAVETWHLPQGCPECQQTGYRGRQLVAELLDLKNPNVASQIQAGPMPLSYVRSPLPMV